MEKMPTATSQEKRTLGENLEDLYGGKNKEPGLAEKTSPLEMKDAFLEKGETEGEKEEDREEILLEVEQTRDNLILKTKSIVESFKRNKEELENIIKKAQELERRIESEGLVGDYKKYKDSPEQEITPNILKDQLKNTEWSAESISSCSLQDLKDGLESENIGWWQLTKKKNLQKLREKMAGYMEEAQPLMEGAKELIEGIDKLREAVYMENIVAGLYPEEEIAHLSQKRGENEPRISKERNPFSPEEVFRAIFKKITENSKALFELKKKYKETSKDDKGEEAADREFREKMEGIFDKETVNKMAGMTIVGEEQRFDPENLEFRYH